MTVEKAKQIVGSNFIGPNELAKVGFIGSFKVPNIPFSENELETKKNDYLLILGVDKMQNNKDLSIRNLLDYFGKDSDINEPCFYNQDWYLHEGFIDKKMTNDWFLIRKDVYEDSRAVMPNELQKVHAFPSAIRCTYAFFVAWFALDIKLWYHDFVWCSDVDHNGDRIYVGKYHDVDGVNKNGFSIHRHLALRKCYGCID